MGPHILLAAALFIFPLLGAAHAAEAQSERSLLTGAARKPELKKATVVEQQGVLVLTLDGEDSSATFSFGPLAAAPETALSVQVEINALTVANEANLQILVRELVGRRPQQPYHKNSVRVRALPPEPGMALKELSFRTGPGVDGISGLLLFSGGPARMEIRSAKLIDSAARQAEQARADRELFKRQIEELRREAAAYKPRTQRPLVYSRSQMKYGLERNYYRPWIDRPLFTDRALRGPTPHVTPFASFERVVAIGQRYGIDGFAFFPETKGRMGIFEMISRINPPAFGVLPEFIGSRNVDAKSALLAAALKCPQAARLNGKLLITSYGADALPAAEWKEILAELRKRHGDSFLFLPSLTQVVRFRQNYNRSAPFSKEDLAKVKQELREYLDVCDGLYFNYPAAFKLYDNQRRFDEGFYRDLFIPIFQSVLNEPQYSGKLLGLSAYHSHYNADISIGLQEDNTRTLRRSFEAAMSARPDVIILPEWDEQNENTSFRPTVYNGLSTMRILRYYMQRIKGEAISPMPGDDSASPNLIVSYRKMLTVGEPLEIELLNVPDGTAQGDYHVVVTLRDESGNVVKTFDAATLPGGELRDVTLIFPTEEVAACRALVPEVRIEGYNGRSMTFGQGMHIVHLRATANWDYKYVCHPLRDALPAPQASIDFSHRDGRVTVRGEIACDRPIAYVETLEDDIVVHAADPGNEYMQDTPGVRLFAVEYRCVRDVPGKLTIRLNRPALKWFTNEPILHQEAGEQSIAAESVSIALTFSPHVRWSLFAVKEEEVGKTAVTLETQAGSASIDLAEVAKLGHWAKTFPNGQFIVVRESRKPVNMPPHINSNRAEFTATLIPDTRASVFHVRVITKDGRVWRSAPFAMPLAGKDAESVPLRIYSETERKPKDVTTSAGRIPDFRYAFEPRHGDILHAVEWPGFSGALGGFPDALTLSGGNGGHSSCMFAGKFGGNSLPQGPITFRPEWTVEDGRPCLRFDGAGAFIAFPRETFPRRGAFVIEFDIKPTRVDTAARQNILVHRIHRQASLTVYIRNGVLRADYAVEGHGVAAVEQGLPVRAGQWSRVRIIRDFENLVLEVDGKRDIIACTEPGFDIGPISFGGYGPAPENWFNGCLGSLRILHNVPRAER